MDGIQRVVAEGPESGDSGGCQGLPGPAGRSFIGIPTIPLAIGGNHKSILSHDLFIHGAGS